MLKMHNLEHIYRTYRERVNINNEQDRKHFY